MSVRCAAAAGLLAASCGGGDSGGALEAGVVHGAAPWFEERAAAAGIDFVHVSGATGAFLFPEIMGGGVALLDHDGDGDRDVYLVQSGSLESDARSGDGPGNRLFENLGRLSFRDATRAAGVGDRGYGMGVAVGDVDGDGDEDLLVTNVGADVLYANRGDGSFEERGAAAGVAGDQWSTSAAFLDHDRDGDLDLFVVHYVVWSPGLERPCLSNAGGRIYCSPNSYEAPAPDALFENGGQGDFRDVSEAAGLFSAFGNGLGLVSCDLDGDGRTDVYVANDGNPNQLWRNRGDGTFRDEAARRSCAVNATGQPEAGMGVQALDPDADDDLDLFLTHLRHETNTYYRNQGGWFEDATARLGLAAPSYAFTGFGLGFHDFDHDGWLDLYVANGRVVFWDPPLDADDVYAEPNLLFAGAQGPVFREVTPQGGTARVLLHTSRGAAFGDLDDDGDVDVVVANRDAAPYLLVNVAPKHGGWVELELREADGRPADDAALRVEAGGRTFARRVERAYGYLSSSDPRVHVGLGEAERVEAVHVRWRDGATEHFGPLAAGERHLLVRGSGRGER